ncbi:MAG: hypothetical protein H0T52_01265 [Lautropia sp.]|nr:hypothetical protein [Lautropia sp.]
MSKLDLKGFLPGASWDSHQDSGYYRTRFMPDGKYQNTLLARGQRNMDSHGYWYVDPKGRACAQPAVEDPTVQPRCSYWFKSRGLYFVSAGNDPGSRVFPRTVRKPAR